MSATYVPFGVITNASNASENRSYGKEDDGNKEPLKPLLSNTPLLTSTKSITLGALVQAHTISLDHRHANTTFFVPAADLVQCRAINPSLPPPPAGHISVYVVEPCLDNVHNYIPITVSVYPRENATSLLNILRADLRYKIVYENDYVEYRPITDNVTVANQPGLPSGYNLATWANDALPARIDRVDEADVVDQ